jgi:hypothetical protein
MSNKDPQKMREKHRRYRERKKVAKYGPEALGVNMTGRHGNHARGPQNAKWNNGLAVHEDGYLKVQVGKGHPMADPNGYAYLHAIVWIAAGNPAPQTDELIHHRDRVKTNNKIDNLELMTRSDHAKEHDAERGRDSRGQFPVGGSTQTAEGAA